MSNSNRSDRFARRVAKVVDRGNCSGCGACALLSPRVQMSLDAEGFLRPVVRREGQRDTNENQFDAVCPGVGLSAPRDSRPASHPELGTYHAAWRAAASDDDTRHAGSSGGVLTALATWLVDSGEVSAVVATAQDPDVRARSRAVIAEQRTEVLATAGSRYAPVENLTTWKARPDVALVAKPCEVSAARRLIAGTDAPSPAPLLSFFCAGTPSQRATEALITKLGVRVEEVDELRYRGRGWPGDFTVSDVRGTRRTMSYKESWGGNLGRDLQWRCKTCVDGTGGDADLAVGDFWRTDTDGYPDFSEGAGESVLIARTTRGLDLALAAHAAGVVSLVSIKLDEVAKIQPLQIQRRRLLLGRLLGRRLAGKPGPRYRGFGLLRSASRRPVSTVRALLGTMRRTWEHRE